MKSQQLAMALVLSVHLDAELALNLSLKREQEKLTRVCENMGLAKAIEWLELKLAWAINPKITSTCPEYSRLRELSFADSEDPGVQKLAVEAFAFARQIVSCLRKTRDIPCREQDVEGLVSWRKRNDSNVALSSEQLVLAEEIRRELNVLIPDDLKLADLLPEAGPGATSEKRSSCDRPFFFALDWASFPGAVLETPCGSRPVAVPKDWKKNRLIMAESSSLMLAQKSLQKWLMRQASSSPMGQYTDFLDQEFQRNKLRRPGMATIDLSDASDHVNRLLVWRVFRDRPVLRRCLFESRSQSTIFGDKILMYSTMGNATTFVVMTYLLAACCRVAESQALNRKVRVPSSSVFGDDIVCSDIIYGSVVWLLSALGFSVNLKKSYCVGDFRESCGLDLFKGQDVTPIKVKSLAAVTKADFPRLLAYANSLFLRGYWRAAFVVETLMCSKWRVSVGYIGCEDVLQSFSCPGLLNGVWHRAWQTFIPRIPKKKAPKRMTRDESCMLQYFLANGNRLSDEVGSTFAAEQDLYLALS
ncbi:RNA-directed RNA polymerase [ssRNA phage SRR7976325_6]|uniref:RNA-directed RNA polymerase n=1 Tax=ssRNA phage SRR7976325_6 TaxID=2786721 RepID=A0A8S5L156_9VIRU|nr:RNA-directed RNA polymerase [ssRNA phage SRR7976325_6]DAD51211.1 TPA_asm: RNA-directed RNA polymerase [ssRNA phage SRR7976325_6]